MIPSPDTAKTQLFIDWFAWSLKFKDCDPAVWLTNYLNNRYEHNTEQRFWLAWLYGHTYQLPTAWVLMNEFPDFELATVDRLSLWNTANYRRLRYQTDTKWNKGHVPTMFESYQKLIKASSQQAYFEGRDFDDLWRDINDNLYKFGRYSTWFYLQHLKHTCDLQIEPTSLMLDDYSGSRSHRNGLVMAVGRDDWYDKKLTAGQYRSLESISKDIVAETKKQYPEVAAEVDFFTMETCLCSFKKIFRTHHGRYLGYYLDRQAEEINQASIDGWNGIEWNVLWQAREETIDSRLLSRDGIDETLFSYYVEKRKLYRVEWLTGAQQESRGLEGLFE